ncbi:hypothetical protein SDC9_167584 [bioreactor metagenome]|uniref:Uncharacterized protein n=1 Tax=bioreactor metagenome TaxID=1076179 RepID=A0A645G207_9ZZZZ
MLFDSERRYLLLRKGDGLVVLGSDETRYASDVAYQMPGIVRHDHFYEDVAGENLAFESLFALVGYLRHGLEWYLYLEYHVLKMAIGHELLYCGLYGIFIAGIGMRDIPFGSVRHSHSPLS